MEKTIRAASILLAVFALASLCLVFLLTSKIPPYTYIAFLSFIVSILGWFKPSTPSLFLTIIAISVSTLVLLTSSIALYNANNKALLNQYYGVLESRTRVILSPKQNVFPKLEFGDSGTKFEFTGPRDTAAINIMNDNELTIELEDGRIQVSLLIRNPEGEIVAELKKNEWKISPPPKTWDRNFTKDSLEVRDPLGDVILQIRLIGDVVQLQGVFRDATGNGVAFIKLEDQTWGGLLRRIGPKDRVNIKPIFKYPSELHLGKLH